MSTERPDRTGDLSPSALRGIFLPMRKLEDVAWLWPTASAFPKPRHGFRSDAL